MIGKDQGYLSTDPNKQWIFDISHTQFYYREYAYLEKGHASQNAVYPYRNGYYDLSNINNQNDVKYVYIFQSGNEKPIYVTLFGEDRCAFHWSGANRVDGIFMTTLELHK